MMSRKSLLVLFLALVLLLSACGAPDKANQPSGEDEAVLSVSLPALPDTLDPLRCTAQGGETVLYHLYENLMRWTDGGDGWAVLAPGQAESYTVETDYAGNATYTFTLREGLTWSDGERLTASDFVSAWQQLADPGTLRPHRELLSSIAGYDEVQETGDVSRLAVSAPDDRTFVVSLNGSCPSFLAEVCASAYTVPRRLSSFDGSVTNGPYVATEASTTHVALERNKSYHSKLKSGPDEIHFYQAGTAESEYQMLQEGTRSLITALPADALEELADSGTWLPEPITSVYGVLLNTRQAPFDDPDVRKAFFLAANPETVTAVLADPLLRAASGLVPYGIPDYGVPAPEKPEEEEPPLPDPNAVPEPDPPKTYWDFRAHSLELVTVQTERDDEADCRQARALLAQAGYPNGSGFPEVEYIYVKSDTAQAIANALCALWRQQLGVTVTAVALSQEDYDARLAAAAQEDGEEEGESTPGENGASEPFRMAAQAISPASNDAGALLELWHGDSEANLSGYRSDAFDILLNAAQNAVSPEVQDAYLHDAEAILLEDSPVIPVCFYGGSYQLSEGLAGLYRLPDGVYFLFNVTQDSSSS